MRKRLQLLRKWRQQRLTLDGFKQQQSLVNRWLNRSKSHRDSRNNFVSVGPLCKCSQHTKAQVENSYFSLTHVLGLSPSLDVGVFVWSYWSVQASDRKWLIINANPTRIAVGRTGYYSEQCYLTFLPQDIFPSRQGISLVKLLNVFLVFIHLLAPVNHFEVNS